jgi:hypothetical protein
VSYQGNCIVKFVRQMRNKDSAMKSRERKKIYVKELEMKSKYLEAECRRLSYALQCHAAENMVLRQSLLKDRPVGAPTAMQESAVLTGKAHQTNMPMLCFVLNSITWAKSGKVVWLLSSCSLVAT